MICRLCLTDLNSDNIVPLFNEFDGGNDPQLLKIIAKYFHLNIAWDDEISINICCECSKHLCEFEKYCVFIREQQIKLSQKVRVEVQNVELMETDIKCESKEDTDTIEILIQYEPNEVIATKEVQLKYEPDKDIVANKIQLQSVPDEDSVTNEIQLKCEPHEDIITKEKESKCEPDEDIITKEIELKCEPEEAVLTEIDLHVKSRVLLQSSEMVSATSSNSEPSRLSRKVKSQRKKRRWAVRPINKDRTTSGYFEKVFLQMKHEDEEQFFIHTRMTRSVYDMLLNLVETPLKKAKQQIGPEQRLAITLLYLADGGSFQSIAWSHKLGKTTVRNIVLQTCEVLWNTLSPIYVSEPTTDQFKNIANDFNKMWNVPNCVGAIDAKHIAINSPKNLGSLFYNYKKFCSIILMAACDAKYTFTMASVGGYGSQSDGVFHHSNFGRAVVSNELPLPSDAPLGNNSSESFPHFLVGDVAFPLKTNLMTPFSGPQLPQIKQIFNYRLSRARRVIENCFGILTARWGVLRSPMECSPENCEKIVLGCIVLHNFIMLTDCKRLYCPDGYADWENSEHNVQGGKWRNDLIPVGGPLYSIKSQRRNATPAAYELRDKLAEYFMNEGAVPYQYRQL